MMDQKCLLQKEQYSLSVKANYTGNSFDVSSQVKSVFLGLAFSHDGTMMYVTDGQMVQPIVFIKLIKVLICLVELL